MYAIKQKQGNRFFNTYQAAKRFQTQQEHDKKIRLDIYKKIETSGGYVHFEKIL